MDSSKKAITASGNIRRYVISSYLFFWFMVLGLCGTASIVFHAPPLVMRILSNVCAWSPTILLFVFFKKFLPTMSRTDFLRRSFSGKLSVPLILISIVSVTGVFLLSALITSKIESIPFASQFSKGTYPVAASVLLSFTSGPTGEECGWRGFLRVELEKKYSFLKANILLGLIWTFWHTVLWFVDNEFTSGLALLIYILSNVIVITSINCIMAVILRKSSNLIYAVLIHFCFNLPYCFLQPTISFYVIMSVLYVLLAAAFLFIFRKDKK